MTVGVVVFPDERSAREAVAWFPDGEPRPGLRALPFPGSVAARFGDAARQTSAAARAPAYVVAATAGYADGRPALRGRRPTWPSSCRSWCGACSGRWPRPRRSAAATGSGGAEAARRALAAVALIMVPAPAHADQVRDAVMPVLESLNVPDAWTMAKGRGVTVAVLDSGVEADQADLAGAVTVGPDLTHGAGPAGARPKRLHGTNMASIIAGHGHGPGNALGMIGVAPRRGCCPCG